MKEWIQNNISRLKKDDLRKVAKIYSISYQEEELDIIYQFIQNHYQDLLDQNTYVFEELKDKISSNLYKQILQIYMELKQKYLS